MSKLWVPFSLRDKGKTNDLRNQMQDIGMGKGGGKESKDASVLFLLNRLSESRE